MLNVDAAVGDVRTKMVEAHKKVLGAQTGFVDSSNLETAAVVFKDLAGDLWGLLAKGEATRLEFFEEMHDGDDFAEGTREGDVLGLRGAEGNKGLEF